MSSVGLLRLETTSQTLLSGAKLSGTTMRLRQLDADHHKAPVTATSGTTDWLARAPGLYCPVAVHRLSALLRSAPVGRSAAGTCVAPSSQLMPMMGIATNEQAT